MKCVQIRSLFWSVFSRIWTEYGVVQSISLYSVRMRENTDQKKLLFWTFSRKKLKSKYNINYRYDINFKVFCSYCSLLVLHKFWIKFHVSITIMKGFCTQMISFEIWNLEKPFSGFSAFLLTTILVIIFWNLVIKF